jgi:hypothetical protein
MMESKTRLKLPKSEKQLSSEERAQRERFVKRRQKKFLLPYCVVVSKDRQGKRYHAADAEQV